MDKNGNAVSSFINYDSFSKKPQKGVSYREDINPMTMHIAVINCDFLTFYYTDGCRFGKPRKL